MHFVFNRFNLFFAWNDYYNSLEILERHENEEFTSKNTTLIIETGNTYVYNCFFTEMTASSGGAILYSLAKSYLLVEKSSFLHCKANADTSSIRVADGNIIIALVCGFNGKTNNNDGFSTTWSGSSRTVNSIFDSSISRCECKEYYTVNARYGYVNIKSVNISHNNAGYYSGIRCQGSIIDASDVGNFISFSSFCNNTASKEICVQVTDDYKQNCKNDIKNTNFIENNCSKALSSKGKTTITKCCILLNGDPSLSPVDDNSQITIINCNIDNKNSISFIEIETTNPFIVALKFIETGECHNFFAYLSPLQYHTTEKTIFLSKIFFNFLYIFVFSHV